MLDFTFVQCNKINITARVFFIVSLMI